MVAPGHGYVSSCGKFPPFLAASVKRVHIVCVSLPHGDSRPSPEHVHTVTQSRHCRGVGGRGLALLVFGLTHAPVQGFQVQAVYGAAYRYSRGILAPEHIGMMIDNHKTMAAPALREDPFSGETAPQGLKKTMDCMITQWRCP